MSFNALSMGSARWETKCTMDSSAMLGVQTVFEQTDLSPKTRDIGSCNRSAGISNLILASVFMKSGLSLALPPFVADPEEGSMNKAHWSLREFAMVALNILLTLCNKSRSRIGSSIKIASNSSAMLKTLCAL